MNKGVIATTLVITIAVIVGALLWFWPGPGPNAASNAPSAGNAKPAQDEANNAVAMSTGDRGDENAGPKANSKTDASKSPKTRKSEPGTSAPPAPKPEETAAASQSPAETYCRADHDKNKTQALAKAGGLVQIFQHEAALSNAYGCATTYLANGGDIDAVDPRADAGHLTPLLFAIKRNDPKMVHFMINHGANLKKRGGSNHIKPYGYAVFEALHNQSTNYNPVINILDSALGSGSNNTQ